MNKRTFPLLLVAILAMVALPALGQYTVQTTSLAGGTANVAATTTNSVTTPVLAVTKSQTVAVQASFKLTGSGTSAVVFNFDHSLDNSTWTANAYSLSVTAAGTSSVNNIAKLTVGGVGYLRLSSVENPNSAAVTNLVLKYAYKPGQ